MGMLSTLGVALAQITIFLCAITFLPGIPPHLDFIEIPHETPLPFEGPLKVNSKLNNGKQLFQGEVKGPEAFAIYSNELYTSLHGGHVVKIVKDKLIPVAKFGKPCEHLWQERTCGRPLGLKFDKKGMLYVADAYYGIWTVNVTTGKSSQLISMNEEIGGKKPMLPNSLDVDGNYVYWTDSSTTHNLDDGVFILLGAGTGRLLRYDIVKKTSEVLLEALSFPNGLALSNDGSFVILAETGHSRIIKYYLHGNKKGTSEVFIDRLPGFPDNLRANGKEGFIVALININEEDKLLSFTKLYSFPTLRKLLSRLMAVCQIIFKQMNNIYPHSFFEKTTHMIGHFESLSFLYSNHVVVIFLNNEGEITASLHATDGNLKSISDLILHQGNYYLGSPYNNYVGMVSVK